MCSNQIHIASTIIFTLDDGTNTEFIRQEQLERVTFGVVYRVTDKKTNKDYAIKVFSKEKYVVQKNKKRLDKLKREFTIQNNLNHPNIVKPYDFFSDDLNYYMLFEYCPGGTARNLIEKSAKGYLSEQDTEKKKLKDVDIKAFIKIIIDALCFEGCLKIALILQFLQNKNHFHSINFKNFSENDFI